MKISTYRLWAALLTLAIGLFFIPPSHSQDPAAQTIESDDPRVLQGGTWSAQNAAPASNGGYLFSSGADEDILGLSFLGSAIEIIYVAGPQLGTLAIEIDGTVVRTVITTSEKTEYAQAARVDYLSEEPHSLQVYAQAGSIIAVDAFRIFPSTSMESATGGEVSPPTAEILEDGNGATRLPNEAGQIQAMIDTGDIQSSICFANNTTFSVSEPSPSGGGLFPNFSDFSPDGRYLAFSSSHPIGLGDTNSALDAFVYDFQTCTLSRVSVPTGGGVGNATPFGGYEPALSSTGRFVAFTSSHSNLVTGDTNVASDVFVHDRQTVTTTRISVATGGTEGNSSSFTPDISYDGRYVVFESNASNLVAGDTNAFKDIFIHDRNTGTTSRLSVDSAGAQANNLSESSSISADGLLVVFESSATNLVAGDTNGTRDIFLRNRQTNTTTRISPATTNGTSADPVISPDGRFVVYLSSASNIVAGDTNAFQDAFLHDRQTGTTTRVSVGTGGTQGTGHTFNATLSADGRFIAFDSLSPNLVPNDTNGDSDIFVYDRATNSTARVSLTSGGAEINGGGQQAIIADNASRVAYVSGADGIIPGDTDTAQDIFVTPYLSARATDTLALFRPEFEGGVILDTLADNPPAERYTYFSAYAPPISAAQWVMGDWNGDGLKTPGVYANGPFYYTNRIGETQSSEWRSLWIGVAGQPVSGHFDDALPNDCIGAVQQGSLGGQTVFTLYFTCDLSGTPTPTISNQWLSAVLPNSGGFTGVHQFGAGDFDGDGIASIAVRRGTSIAFGNVAPPDGNAAFNLAQFIGAPSTNDTGIFVVGNWDVDIYDSFGLFYQNGEFFYRNDLLFNSGAYGNQSVSTPLGSTNVQATSWR